MAFAETHKCGTRGTRCSGGQAAGAGSTALAAQRSGILAYLRTYAALGRAALCCAVLRCAVLRFGLRFFFKSLHQRLVMVLWLISGFISGVSAVDGTVNQKYDPEIARPKISRKLQTLSLRKKNKACGPAACAHGCTKAPRGTQRSAARRSAAMLSAFSYFPDGAPMDRRPNPYGPPMDRPMDRPMDHGLVREICTLF